MCSTEFKLNLQSEDKPWNIRHHFPIGLNALQEGETNGLSRRGSPVRWGYVSPCCPLVLLQRSWVLGARRRPYRGGGRQDDVPNGGFELVDGGSVLERVVVWLDGLDFHVELPGLVLVLRVAGRVEGILFGMWGTKSQGDNDDEEGEEFKWQRK